MNLTSIPSLVGLRAFLVVGETGSIRRAGEVLNTDHAALSRHVSNLELILGVQLFDKKPAGMKLTSIGEQYHKQVRHAFCTLYNATNDVRATRTQVLTIHASPGLAHEVMLPAIPDLARAVSGWKINLLTAVQDNFACFDTTDSVHVQIRFGAAPDLPSELVQSEIYSPRIFPVVSPSFLEHHGQIRSLEALLAVPSLCTDALGMWERWSASANLEYSAPHFSIEMPNTHLALQAAALGQGIALGNSLLVRRAIERGDLVELLETQVYLDSYFLICNKKNRDSTPVAELSAWLTELCNAA